MKSHNARPLTEWHSVLITSCALSAKGSQEAVGPTKELHPSPSSLASPLTTHLSSWSGLYAQWLSRVQLFVTPQTTACQAALFMEFSRQEYWSGLPCPTPGVDYVDYIKHKCLVKGHFSRN